MVWIRLYSAKLVEGPWMRPSHSIITPSCLTATLFLDHWVSVTECERFHPYCLMAIDKTVIAYLFILLHIFVNESLSSYWHWSWTSRELAFHDTGKSSFWTSALRHFTVRERRQSQNYPCINFHLLSWVFSSIRSDDMQDLRQRAIDPRLLTYIDSPFSDRISDFFRCILVLLQYRIVHVGILSTSFNPKGFWSLS
jgi:hypothetical protein